MNDVIKIIGSGILELYVLGQTTEQESAEVERMATIHPDIRSEIDAISNTLEQYALAHAVEPSPTVKPFIMATIDYMERMKNGEAPTFPPLLHASSAISDYDQWLGREDLQLQGPLTETEARIIGYTPQVTTAIVWLTEGAPPETHTNELETFLVVEGACDITIGAEIHHMKAGGVLRIPLHISHHVRVTSHFPCKVILQRAAA
jgi:mannose-6-phosphate isomerase-like protein (cupin superfamily)